MRTIEKNTEPRSLLEYRAIPDTDYISMDADVKRDLKVALLQEQGYVCCYCMKRISYDNMKVEHLQSQKDYPSKDLVYGNMFAACCGNEGYPKAHQHCDTRKGDDELGFDLKSPLLTKKIDYNSNGTIYSSDPIIDYDINRKLNLNIERLRDNRKVVIDEAIQNLITIQKKGNWSVKTLKVELSKWSCLNRESKYPEYYGAAINYIEKKIRNMTR